MNNSVKIGVQAKNTAHFLGHTFNSKTTTDFPLTGVVMKSLADDILSMIFAGT